MADGLTISNFLQMALTITATELGSCDSDNLKGTHTIQANDAASFDVSGHSGESCHLTASVKDGDGKTRAVFGLTMSDGNPAHIQEFGVQDEDGIRMYQKGEGNIVIVNK
ncbi:MAG: hypothetical protein AAF666_16905 [Pseudomonadota bacterium]